MLIENMKMAFSALRANKLRSFLTMLGIIIGIGSVISIVSIGDTMRELFSSLYRDVGVTQAYVSIGYWVDDVRESDYFTMDDLEKIKNVFGDQIAYIDSSMSTSAEAVSGADKMEFDYEGIDCNYIDVQPVDILYGRYLNEADVKGRKENAVIDVDTARNFFHTDNAVGRQFRTVLFGEVKEFTVVGVYEKEMSPFQKLMMGVSEERGAAFIPWTLLTWPNDRFYGCRLYADESMTSQELTRFYDNLAFYVAKLKNREPEDWLVQTAMEEMGQVDSLMSGLSAAEIGLDVRVAKRAGLLHDIGKSVDHDMEGTHIQLGVDICRKYKESAIVINAVEAHHGDVEPESLIACVVQAADAISASRPGARRETLETYTNRLKQLEDITDSFEGVEKSFAIQAGREIRVMVVPEKVSDADMVLMARDISKQIEAELEYPGQIKVNVIRESRVTDYAK